MSGHKVTGTGFRTALCIGAMLFGTLVHAAIPAGERNVLDNLYTATNGAGWTTRTGWNGAPGTECNWYGVTCDAGGTTVLEIALEQNNLTGSLPALAGLSELKYFFRRQPAVRRCALGA